MGRDGAEVLWVFHGLHKTESVSAVGHIRSVATFKTTILLQIKHWTLWYIYATALYLIRRNHYKLLKMAHFWPTMYMEKQTRCMYTWATKRSQNAISSILKWWLGAVHGVSSRETGVGIVPTLVVVKLDIEFLQLGEVNAQCATAIVDVLPIQWLSTVNIAMRGSLDRH